MHEGAVHSIEPSLEMDAPDSLARLTNLFIRQIGFFTSNRIYSVVFFREYRALSANRRAEIEAEGDKYRAAVAKLLTSGQRDGSIAADLDVRMTSMALVEMLNSVHRWFNPEGRISATRLARSMTAMLILGVASAGAIEAHGGADALRREILAGWASN